MPEPPPSPPPPRPALPTPAGIERLGEKASKASCVCYEALVAPMLCLGSYPRRLWPS